MIIDRKYKILAVNPCKLGSARTEEHGVFFEAHDVAFLEGALPGYRAKCIELGAGTEQIESIDLLIKRVASYQAVNGKKIPDTELDCEIDRCIGGNL
ncbi:hypothetical protein KAR91_71355 [Candidatus Pacearchaeota archaeon]|nr:hypothetical protein [Candidatus Pacearchaeota archaeon]